MSDFVTDNPPHPAVTRLEILDAVDQAFVAPPATKAEILATAADSGARPELITALRHLPERHFGNVRDLWEHLPDIPVDT